MKKLAILTTLISGLALPLIGYSAEVTPEQEARKEISTHCQGCSDRDSDCKVPDGVQDVKVKESGTGVLSDDS